jgi:anti-sigma B factor antagonist
VSFAARVEPQGSVMLVAFEGELDMATEAPAREALAVAEATSPGVLVVDLRDLAFMDSTGLKLVLEAELRSRAGGWGFAVVRGDGMVRRLLRVTRLEDRFPVVDDPGQVPLTRLA